MIDSLAATDIEIRLQQVAAVFEEVAAADDLVAAQHSTHSTTHQQAAGSTLLQVTAES